MKLMVVGGGGREHAIIKKLRENPAVEVIYALPGNGGMANDAVCVPIKATDLPAIRDFAVDHRIDFAVVAPDDPLVLGCADLLEEAGIPVFGPKKNAAVIRYSPGWTPPWTMFAPPPCPPSSKPTGWRWARASSSPRPVRRPRPPSAP